LWRTPISYFILQTSHWHAKGFLRNLWTISARAFNVIRQPWPRRSTGPNQPPVHCTTGDTVY